MADDVLQEGRTDQDRQDLSDVRANSLATDFLHRAAECGLDWPGKTGDRQVLMRRLGRHFALLIARELREAERLAVLEAGIDAKES